MDTQTATTVLIILGTSFGAILAAMITLIVASIRIQHRDSTATRQLITDASKENRDLIDKSNTELQGLIGKSNTELQSLTNKNRDLIDKNRDLFDKNHGVVISLLGDTRERLARIEGYLRIGWPATDDPETDGNNREAA